MAEGAKPMEGGQHVSECVWDMYRIMHVREIVVVCGKSLRYFAEPEQNFGHYAEGLLRGIPQASGDCFKQTLTAGSLERLCRKALKGTRQSLHNASMTLICVNGELFASCAIPAHASYADHCGSGLIHDARRLSDTKDG